MSSQLTVDQLATRLNNFPYERYLYIGGFMRSVAWAAGTIVLLQLIRQPEKESERVYFHPDRKARMFESR
jgi:hypothetical protein